MSQRVVIPLLVATAFGAGFVARLWTESGASLPTLPTVGSEFAPASTSANGEVKPATPRAIDRTKMIADIEKLRPQIEAYQKRMVEIEADFERDFLPILDVEQLQHYNARKEKKKIEGEKMQGPAFEDHTRALLTDDQIERFRRTPLLVALDTVAVTPRFNFVTREYKLTESQQTAVREILKSRREKFLRLIDEIPPPTIQLTIQLTRLAPMVEKLGEPAAPSPAK